jgi:hypothetical protein
MHAHRYELPIRVLYYAERRDYIAHALEVDLVAYRQSSLAGLHRESFMRAVRATQLVVCDPRLAKVPWPAPPVRGDPAPSFARCGC